MNTRFSLPTVPITRISRGPGLSGMAAERDEDQYGPRVYALEGSPRPGGLNYTGISVRVPLNATFADIRELI